MAGTLDKVTAFVVRPAAAGYDLLLFEHHAGSIQVPAGTVEPDETPRAAALREAREETGLADLAIARDLGAVETPLTDERRALLATTPVYARPTVRSCGAASGCAARAGRRASPTSPTRNGTARTVPATSPIRSPGGCRRRRWPTSSAGTSSC